MATMNVTNHPLSGLWRPLGLKYMYYGNNIVQERLLGLLPTRHSKVAIVTGHSLTTETPLIKELEDLLGPDHHAITISSIKQHAPVADLHNAVKLIYDNPAIDTLVSVGGGSPIDSTKWISIKLREMRDTDSDSKKFSSDEGYLTHICIPTTLSASECTAHAAYTDEQGDKTTIGGHPLVSPTAILYDPHFASYTPPRLWLSTGIRALDHSIELLIHPSATEVPCKIMCLHAAQLLFHHLPIAKRTHTGTGPGPGPGLNLSPSTNPDSNSNPDSDSHDMNTEPDNETTINLFHASFASLSFIGGTLTSTLGLSHSLGYALGCRYDIPHGETSCMTLAPAMALKARAKTQDAKELARLLPYISSSSFSTSSSTSGNGMNETPLQAALLVSTAVANLIADLDLNRTLTEYGVGRGQVDSIVAGALWGKVLSDNSKKKNNNNKKEVDDEEEEEEFVQRVRKLVEGLF